MAEGGREPVTPHPGEAALWGTLQGGEPPKAQRKVTTADRVRGALMAGVWVAAMSVQAWRSAGPIAPGEWLETFPVVELAINLAVAAAIYWGWLFAVRRGIAREYQRPATAWFLSRERLVTSSADGAGEAIPVADIRAVSPTYSEGAPALELETETSRHMVLAADRTGLLTALRSLRPDL